MSKLAILLLILSQQNVGVLLCRLDAFSEELQAEFQEVEVEGVYETSFEVRAFTPTGSNERWWVASKDLNDLMRSNGATRLRIIIRGQLSPEGRYGHARSYRRCMANPKVVKVLGPPADE